MIEPENYGSAPMKAPKAYANPSFLNSPEARSIRILSEYMEPQTRFKAQNVTGAVVVYGSARIRPSEDIDKRLQAIEKLLTRDPDAGELAALQREQSSLQGMRKLCRYYTEATELSRKLTQWAQSHIPESGEKRFVICTGGGPGIMEAANLGAYQAGGQSIGLNISLPFEQYPNPYIWPSLNFEFHYFFMRKFFFMSLANAIIAFPGGFGTLDELAETLTLVQTGKSGEDIPIVLYGTEYWDHVIDLPKMAEFGMIDEEDTRLLHYSDDVEDAFEFLTTQLARIHDLD